MDCTHWDRSKWAIPGLYVFSLVTIAGQCNPLDTPPPAMSRASTKPDAVGQEADTRLFVRLSLRTFTSF